MEQFVKGDLLEGANAYYCEKCDKKVSLPTNGVDFPTQGLRIVSDLVGVNYT